jgi:YbbR domain-containing protein
MSARWLTDNLVWKLLCLALSAALWLIFVGESEVSTLTTAPVQYRNVPKNLEMSSDVLDRMQIEIRGPSGQLNPAQLAEAAVVLDLAQVKGPGQRTFTVRPDNVSLPGGVTFTRAVPAQVRLEFERRLEKDVPVAVRLAAQPPAGYTARAIEVIPRTLRIVGPESRVESVEAAQTDPIDLSGVTESREFPVHAYVADPQVRFDKPPEVRVRFEVRRAARNVPEVRSRKE